MPAHRQRLSSLTRPQTLLLSCEHGGNEIPRSYASLFDSAAARSALSSHRGYDLGARAVASRMAELLGAPLVLATTSRLLVDLNRSIGHRRLFSEFTRPLSAPMRETLLEEIYRPHRASIETAIAETIGRRGRCVHVAVHSFTPVLDGQRRRAAIGLLYDPSRSSETALCRMWQTGLAAAGLRVRRNYPYRGAADGLTTAMRRRFDDRRYAGIELEINQAELASARGCERLARLSGETLAEALLSWSRP